MFARCEGEFIHARSTSAESEKRTARFSPAYANEYPFSPNQCHGENPSGLWCAKYPFAAISSALSCAALCKIGFTLREMSSFEARSMLVKSTSADSMTAARKTWDRTKTLWSENAATERRIIIRATVRTARTRKNRGL